MSCDVFERHFLGFLDGEEFDRHRESCPLCQRDARGLVGWARALSPLGPPSVPPSAIDRWRQIPSRTMHCDAAAEAIARRIEGDASPEESSRLDFHLSRCEGCAESAAVLGLVSELKAPETTARLGRRPARVVAIDSARRRSRARDPRLYAAAACLLAGLSTFLAGPGTAGEGGIQSITAGLTSSIRVRAAEAGERLNLWEETFSRRVIAVRESVAGYGRAAGSIALSAAGRATEELLARKTKNEKGKKS